MDMERRGIQTTAGDIWRDAYGRLEQVREVVSSLRERFAETVCVKWPRRCVARISRLWRPHMSTSGNSTGRQNAVSSRNAISAVTGMMGSACENLKRRLKTLAFLVCVVFG